MALRIHHLNCTTLRPPCARLINGVGSLLSRGRLVCHCLLVETNEGLVLIDTGLGLTYIADSVKQVGRLLAFVLNTPLDPSETAAHQIIQLGFKRKDVRHIIVTHLDLDHAGGLPDFPDALVHVLSQEYEAAMDPPTPFERKRYFTDHWSHGPKWVAHKLQGDQWFKFDDVQEILPEVLLVPIIGHSRGHCGVAVRSQKGWILHCGDAYTDRAQIDIGLRHCPSGAKLHRRFTEVDRNANSRWPRLLGEIVRNHANEISVFCSHDPVEFSGCFGSV